MDEEEEEPLLNPPGSANNSFQRINLSVNGEDGFEFGIFGRSVVGRPKVETKASDYNSLDFDRCENQLLYQRRLHMTHRERVKEEIVRWILTCAIGVLTAFSAFFIDFGTRTISKYKLRAVEKLLGENENQHFIVPLLVYLTMNGVLCWISATLVVFLEPVAAGSGIPEVKCYLNGVRIPRVVRFQTLVTKLLGVLFSVSGGLFVGKEGPMIHSGAAIAAGISTGKSNSLKLDTGLFKEFRDDREKRDFVVAGSAAGVAAAFGAPIGGVLFSLEEGASFWNQSLTWKSFFCAMVTTFSLNVMLSYWYILEHGSVAQNGGNSKGTILNNPGLVSFGEFGNSSYEIWEVPFFVVMGAVGGLVGAFFNALNIWLTKLRKRYVSTKLARWLEPMGVGVVTTLVTFLFVRYLHKCVPIPPHSTAAEKRYLKTPAGGAFCKPGYYNDLALFFFPALEDTIQHLYHDQVKVETSSLFLYVCCFFLLVCVTYGIAVPSGLFVPLIACGAAYGKLVGQLISYMGLQASGPVYALMGSAALLGGVLRMTISLTVILLEATQQLQFGLPIMLTLITAKWVGDLFNIGLYDMHIELKHIPFLEWEPTEEMDRLLACDVMHSPAKKLHYQPQLKTIINLLKYTKHGGYPIINSKGMLIGSILRTQLLLLLEREAWKCVEGLTYHDFIKTHLPPDEGVLIEKVEDSGAMHETLDLRPYINTTTTVLRTHTPLARVFRVFRTMGLRHIFIVDDANHVEGVITRKDLCHLHVNEENEGQPKNTSSDL